MPSKDPSVLTLILYTHLYCMSFLFFGFLTISHVWFLLSALIFSFMAIFYLSFLIVSLKVWEIGMVRKQWRLCEIPSEERKWEIGFFYSISNSFPNRYRSIETSINGEDNCDYIPGSIIESWTYNWIEAGFLFLE